MATEQVLEQWLKNSSGVKISPCSYVASVIMTDGTRLDVTIEGLKQLLSNHTSSISSLTTTVGEHTTSIGSLNSSVGSLGTRMGSCESAIQNAKTIAKSYSPSLIYATDNGDPFNPMTVTGGSMEPGELRQVDLRRDAYYYGHEDGNYWLHFTYLNCPEGGRYFVITPNGVGTKEGGANIATLRQSNVENGTREQTSYLIWRVE